MLAAGERALIAHDAPGAAGLASRLSACDPTDEAAARLAMEAVHRLGDRDAVRRIFRQLSDALHDELGVEPAAETIGLHRALMVAEIPPRPTSALAPTRAANDDPLPANAVSTIARAPLSSVPPAVGEAPSGRRRRVALAIVAAVVAAVAVAVVAVGFGTRGRGSVPRSSPSVTLRFEPLRAAVDDSPALALRTGLSAEVARLIVGNDDALRVVDASQVDAATSNSWFHVGGETRSDAGLLHVTIHLTHEPDGPILWSRTFVRPAGEVDALREEVASKLGDVSICALGRNNPQATAFGAEAMRLLLSACEQKHLMNLVETTKLFEKLLVLQPDFAHGWAMLAAGKQFSAAGRADGAALEEEAERDAQHALTLNPNDGEAYYARALRLGGIDRWSQRMDVLAKGHALDPGNGQLDNAIAGELERVGRWHEAAAFHHRAVSADPFGVYKAAGLVYNLGFGGDTGEAMAALQVARKRFANHLAIAKVDFEFNALLGDPRRALALLQDPASGFTLPPEEAAQWAGLIAARAEPSGQAEARVDSAIADAIRSGESSRLVLDALASRGRVDDAYAYLDGRGEDLRDRLPTAALFDIIARPLRADPRFMTVAARAGLVAIWTATERWPDFCDDRTLPYDCRVEAQRAVSSNQRPLSGPKPAG